MERVDLSYIASLLEVLLGIFSLKSEPSPYSTACVQGAQGGGGGGGGGCTQATVDCSQSTIFQ